MDDIAVVSDGDKPEPILVYRHYILPYAGADLRRLSWSKVLDIIQQQASVYKTFEILVAAKDMKRIQSKVKHILTFNKMFLEQLNAFPYLVPEMAKLLRFNEDLEVNSDDETLQQNGWNGFHATQRNR